MTFYISINGRPSCVSKLSLDDYEHDIEYRPCISCAHGTSESAEEDAKRIREAHPDANVLVKVGPCPAQGEYDHDYEDSEPPDPWQAFLAGEWTKEVPTEPGIYPVATADGEQTLLPLVIGRLSDQLHYSMGGRSSQDGSEIWKGYFWSRPIPSLPPVKGDGQD